MSKRLIERVFRIRVIGTISTDIELYFNGILVFVSSSLNPMSQVRLKVYFESRILAVRI